MIVHLTGTLVELLPSYAVLDVGGVGYELGISSSTATALPQVGTAGVSIYTRLIVREDAMDLYGFATREERSVFDKLVAISGVGPKLALSVLSTFTPAQLAVVVSTQDIARMATVPGVGKRKGQRLLVELEGVFAKDKELQGLVGMEMPSAAASVAPSTAVTIAQEANEALLSMGFTPREAEIALEGLDEAGVTTIEQALSFALRRLGGGM